MTGSIQAIFESGEQARQSYKYEESKKLFSAALSQLSALDASEQAKLAYLKGKILNVLGIVCGQLEEYSVALNYLEEALQVRETSAKSQLEQASTLSNLGLINESQDKLEKAEHYYNQALDRLRTLGDRLDARRIKAIVLNNLSLVKSSLGLHSGISDLLDEALSDFLSVDDKLGIGQTLHNMGYTEYTSLNSGNGLSYDTGAVLTTDSFRSIRESYVKALKIRQEIQDKLGEARTSNSLGCLYGEYVAVVGADSEGLLDQATTYLESAEQLFEKVRDPVGINLVESSFEVVENARHQIRVDGARGAVEASANIFRRGRQFVDRVDELF